MSAKQVETHSSMRLRWPIEDVIAYAKRYAVTHGLLSLVPDTFDNASVVPFSLFPSPFSRQHFQFIWSIQTAYNRLYHRLSLDDIILEEALSSVLPVDQFVARLWTIHGTTVQRQPIQLNIYRSNNKQYSIDIHRCRHKFCYHK
jgi:glutathione synthase